MRATARIGAGAVLWAGAGMLAACGGPPDGPSTAATAGTFREWSVLTSEWQDDFVACAQDKGLPAVVSGDAIVGGSSPDRPVAPDVGLDAECVEEVGLPPQSPALTDDTLRRLYDAYVAQRDCIEAGGVAVSEPPSRDAWVSDYRSGVPWTPLDVLMQRGVDVTPLMATCPEPHPSDVAE